MDYTVFFGYKRGTPILGNVCMAFLELGVYVGGF